MRFLLKTTITLFLLAACALPVYLFMATPAKVEMLVRDGIRQAGFAQFEATDTQRRYGAVVFTGITLDEDGFSTLESVRANYSWAGIFLKRKLKNLTFENLRLTGEINGANGITLAGWTPAVPQESKSFSQTEEITIENAAIDLLSDTIGGINLTCNIQIRHKPKGGMTIMGQVKGHQRQASLEGNFHSEMSANGNWGANVEIESGKIDLDIISASRLSGVSEIYGIGIKPVKFVTQLNAGAMNVMGLPWQGASVSIEGTPHIFKTVMEGKSIGVEGIEFGATILYENGVQNLEGSMHMDKLSSLYRFLQDNKFLPVDQNPPAFFEALNSLSLAFEQTGILKDTKIKTYSYSIKDEQGLMDLAGDLKIDFEKQNAAGNIALSPVRLERVAEAQNLDHDGIRGGNVDVSGSFESDFSAGNFKLGGDIGINLKNIRYRLDPLTLENVTGTVHMTDLQNWSSAKPSPLTFLLPLKSTITHQGKADLKMLKGGKPALNDPSLKIFDGTISSNSLDLLKKISQQPPKITLENIDLAQLSPALGIDALYLAGRIGGTLPLAQGDSGLYIRGGTLRSTTPGTIRFIPDIAPDIFKGGDIYAETMRMALENYHYSVLDIRISGPLSGELSIDVSAQGLNPELFEGRPVDIDLSFKVPADTILKNLAR